MEGAGGDWTGSDDGDGDDDDSNDWSGAVNASPVLMDGDCW